MWRTHTRNIRTGKKLYPLCMVELQSVGNSRGPLPELRVLPAFARDEFSHSSGGGK
jgi:hypothetical protein